MSFRVFLLVSSVLAFTPLFSSPASAKILITGGTDAQQSVLTRAYNALPNCCRDETVVTVRLLDDRAMNGLLTSIAASQGRRIRCEAVDGVYSRSSNTISLRTPPTTPGNAATFLHEYGHLVWRRLLSEDQREQYRTIYDAELASQHLVSPYSRASLEEGFAEAFSFHCRQPGVLNKCAPLSCTCLDGWFHRPNADDAKPAAPR